MELQHPVRGDGQLAAEVKGEDAGNVAVGEAGEDGAREGGGERREEGFQRGTVGVLVAEVAEDHGGGAGEEAVYHAVEDDVFGYAGYISPEYDNEDFKRNGYSFTVQTNSSAV